MPQNKAPQVFGFTATVGSYMGTSTVAPASFPSNVSFQAGDFVVDPYSSNPGIWICTVAGAGGTATFVRAGSTAQSGSSFSALSVQTLTVTSASNLSQTRVSGALNATSTVTVMGSTNTFGAFGVTPTTRLVSLDTATVEAIRILKALGFCTTG